AMPKKVSVHDAFADVRKALLEIESYDDGHELNAYYKEAVARIRNNLSSIESAALKLGYDLRRCSMGQLYGDRRMGSQSIKGLVYGQDWAVHENNAGFDCINAQVNSVCELHDVISLHIMYQAKNLGKKEFVVAVGYPLIYHLVHMLEKVGC